MKRLYTYIIYVFSALAPLTGCGLIYDDFPETATEEEGDPVYLRLTFRTSGSLGTRANDPDLEGKPTGGEEGDAQQDGEVDENTINNVTLFLFDASVPMEGNTETPIDKVVEISDSELSDNPVTIKVTGLTKDDYHILAVANKKYGGLAPSTLGALQTETITDNPWDKENGFIMSSEKLATVTGVQSSTEQYPAMATIDLERLAAKVTCEIHPYYIFRLGGENSNRNQVRATIEGVTLINIPDYSIGGTYLFKRLSSDPEGGNAVRYLEDERDNANPDTWWVVDARSKAWKLENEHQFYVDDRHYPHIDASNLTGWVTYTFEENASENTWEKELLGYTIENTNEIHSDYDLREYATGVLFKVHYEPYGDGVTGEFYVYENKAYASIEELIAAYPDKFADLTKDNYQKYGIAKYGEGYSYLPYWIKHDEDHNDAEYGVMEYGIVRNNLYELYVESITDFGEMIVSVKAWDKWDTEDVLVTEPSTNTGGE